MVDESTQQTPSVQEQTPTPAPETIASSQFPRGMRVLHEDPDAFADVCFVHGLTGGRRSAWTADGQSEPWLKTLLPSHLNKVRILSFGYDPFHGHFQESTHFHSHAVDLLNNVAYHRRHTQLRPLIFIAHCIGGLVCQEAINISRSSQSNALANVFRALNSNIFISTPYLDESWKAYWERIPTSMLDLEGVAHLADLIQTKHSQGDVFDFELIRGRFFRAMKDRLEDGAPVNITFLFAELEATGIVRVIPGNFEFARIINFEFVPIRANHIDIIKLSSTESQSFKPIVTRLNTWIAQIASSRQTSAPRFDASTMASFQTGRSTVYDHNGQLRRQRHRDHLPRQPEPQPNIPPQYEVFDPSLFPASASPPASFFIIRPCYAFCFLMFLIIGGSASLGIYYSVKYNKMGDGFTAAGWIVAIGTLILAGPLARHYPYCSCWGTTRPIHSHELIHMNTPPTFMRR